MKLEGYFVRSKGGVSKGERAGISVLKGVS